MEYRIQSRYPYYCNGCEPFTAYFVQCKGDGLFARWKDIKGFASPEKARRLLKLLKEG